MFGQSRRPAAKRGKNSPKNRTASRTGTAAKTRKNSQVLRSDRTAKTPEDLAAFTVSGTAQTPAHNEIICGMLCFFGRRSACLAAFISAGNGCTSSPGMGALRQGGLLFSWAFLGCFGINRLAHPPFLSFREWFTREQ